MTISPLTLYVVKTFNLPDLPPVTGNKFTVSVALGISSIILQVSKKATLNVWKHIVLIT